MLTQQLVDCFYRLLPAAATLSRHVSAPYRKTVVLHCVRLQPPASRGSQTR